MRATAQASQASESFACFGSTCAVQVSGSGPAGTAEDAVRMAKRRLLSWHGRLSRFDPTSELCWLNSHPGHTVAVSAEMAHFVAAAIDACRLTDGLVDPTLLDELETAGYRSDLAGGLPLRLALAAAPPRRPARPRPDSRWREIGVGGERTVSRPPSVRLDSGGIAKGLVADLLAERLAGHPSFAVDCAGDLRIGGADTAPREVRVESPFDERVLHAFELAATAVATSGIGRRAWLDEDGAPAHHLIDPATGRPAFTGVVQATALAPSALEAEARAKAAVLSGPDSGRAWLRHGGVLVLDGGSWEVTAPSVRRLG
jgi:FAD:protein FMN transferase